MPQLKLIYFANLNDHVDIFRDQLYLVKLEIVISKRY